MLLSAKYRDERHPSCPETLPAKAEEFLGGAPAFPGSRTGGQALGFTSTRLLSRRAPARGIPMLWGRTCPAFARWIFASPAAQPSRLRTLPEILGKRGKAGLKIGDARPETRSTGRAAPAQCHRGTGASAGRAVS